MHKVLAVMTALVTVITVILGMAAYLDLTSAAKYHQVTGFLALVLVLLATHRLYHGSGGKK
ncbi:MAG: hypothetical protein MJA84_12255 [Firmicutes bacterium]|nr:hypothetical protein [Bacillota bacterium]